MSFIDSFSEEVRNHITGVRFWDTSIAESRSDITVEIRDAGPADDGESPAVEASEKPLTISGLGAVFDKPSLPIYGMFIEKIKRGAFKEELATNPDVRLLVNHDGLPYARTLNKSMSVIEKPAGLAFNATLADTDDSETLYELVDGGYVTQCSFAFRVPKGGDSWDCACGDPFGPECDCAASQIVRTITKIVGLQEISIVTFPAYPDTSVQVARNVEQVGEQSAQAVRNDQREDSAPTLAASNTDASNPTNHAHALRVWADSLGDKYYEPSNKGTTCS